MKVAIALLMAVASSGVFSADDATVANRSDKFKVTHEEALKMLNIMKSDVAKHKRPNPKNVAYVAGGENAQNHSKDDVLSENCYADESQFQTIQRTVLNKWISSWKKRDLTAFNKLLTKKADITQLLSKLPSEGYKKLGTINLYQWGESKKGNNLKEYLDTFKSIEDLDLVTMKYTSPRSFRNGKMDMVKADLQVRFDLRGLTKDGLRRNDRGPLKVTVVKKGNDWKIAEISQWGMETLTNNKPSFKDITKLSGVDKIPEYQRVEAIRRGGYAIGIGDYNRDGIQDMYVGSYGPGKLLQGQKDGTFKVARNTGLSPDTYVKTSVFADFNNDGHQDLLLIRFVPTPDPIRRNDIVMYQNDGKGSFSRIEAVKDKSPTDYAMPAAVADFNGDSFLDFYVGFPGAKDFTAFGNVQNRPGLKAQGLYFNKGDLSFTENGLGKYAQDNFNTFAHQQKIFPHSAVSLDFDQDGDMDVVVVDDQGNLSPAYVNNGKGKFYQAKKELGISNSGYGMGLAGSDIDNDGILDMVLTNVNFTVSYRMDQSCKANWNQIITDARDHGFRFFKGIRKGKYADATGENGLGYAGEGLAGVEFIDYNNDGHDDIYVANGLWSGTNKEDELSYYYTISRQDNKFRDLMTVRDQTQSLTMSILSGFKGNISNGKNGNSRPHLAGFQRNRLFRNNGDGTFVEVGYLEGADSIADGYVIAKADIDSDGDVDLILRNADPGSADVNFPAVQVYRNESGGNSLRVKLASKNSNRDAIGSHVEVYLKDKVLNKQLIANNGTAQSEKVLHFGLGEETMAKKVVVTWPNGKSQTLKNVKMGTIEIEEKIRSFANK